MLARLIVAITTTCVLLGLIEEQAQAQGKVHNFPCDWESVKGAHQMGSTLVWAAELAENISSGLESIKNAELAAKKQTTEKGDGALGSDSAAVEENAATAVSLSGGGDGSPGTVESSPQVVVDKRTQLDEFLATLKKIKKRKSTEFPNLESLEAAVEGFPNGTLSTKFDFVSAEVQLQRLVGALSSICAPLFGEDYCSAVAAGQERAPENDPLEKAVECLPHGDDLSAQWDAWKTFFTDSPFDPKVIRESGASELRQATIASTRETVAKSEIEDARRWLLVSGWEEIAKNRTVTDWLLNVQRAAELGTVSKAQDLLGELDKQPALSQMRYTRLWKKLRRIAGEGTKPDAAPDAIETSLKWLSELARCGGNLKLGQALDPTFRDEGDRCSYFKSMVAPEGPATPNGFSQLDLKLAKQVAERFADFTRQAIPIQECNLEQLETEPEGAAVLLYDACSAQLRERTESGIRWSVHFAQQFNGELRYYSRAFELMQSALRRIEQEGVAVPAELKGEVLLELATAARAVGRSSQAVQLLRSALNLVKQKQLKLRLLELWARSLSDLGEEVEAAAKYRDAAEMVGQSGVEAKQSAWTYNSQSIRALVRAHLNQAVIPPSAALEAKIDEQLERGKRLWKNQGRSERSKLLVTRAQLKEAQLHWTAAARLYEEAFKNDSDEPGSGSDHRFEAEYASYLQRRGRWSEAASFARGVLQKKAVGLGEICLNTPIKSARYIVVLEAAAIAESLRLGRAPADKGDRLEACLARAMGDLETVSSARGLYRSMASLNSLAATMLLAKDSSTETRELAFHILRNLKTMVERVEAYSTAELLGGYQLNRVASKDERTLTTHETALHYFAYNQPGAARTKAVDHLLLVQVDQKDGAPRYQGHDLGELEKLTYLVRQAARHAANKASSPYGVLERAHRALLPKQLTFNEGTKKLLIGAHGLLQTFPFAALYDGKQFLAQRFEIAYLVEHKPVRSSDVNTTEELHRALIVGAPAFQGRRIHVFPERDGSISRKKIWPTLPRLVGAKQEVSRVSKALGSGWLPTTLTGTDATESALRSALSQKYRIVHIATHGLSRTKGSGDRTLGAQTEQIALALSRATGSLSVDPNNDGWLTEEELSSNRDLASTEMIVLSACETGLGSARAGLQLAGLRRALLLRAGAHSVVSSLWKVNDVVTSELMEQFYQTLAAGATRAVALSDASHHIRRKYKHPYYWAAFQLHGETDVIVSH